MSALRRKIATLVRARRGDRSFREAAAECGVSHGTLMRLEKGLPPDLPTFAKVCRWTGVDPGKVLGFKPPSKPKFAASGALDADEIAYLIRASDRALRILNESELD